METNNKAPDTANPGDGHKNKNLPNTNKEKADNRSPEKDQTEEATGYQLPNTATNSFNYLLAGFAALILGAFGFKHRKQHN